MVFFKSKLVKVHQNINKIQKIKYKKTMDDVHVYMCLHTASIKFTAGNTTRLFPSPFHVFTSSRLTFAGAFRNDHVEACSTALRSATEENESIAYVTVPCPSKVT